MFSPEHLFCALKPLGTSPGLTSENVCGPIAFGLVVLITVSFSPLDTFAGPLKNGTGWRFLPLPTNRSFILIVTGPVPIG